MFRIGVAHGRALLRTLCPEGMFPDGAVGIFGSESSGFLDSTRVSAHSYPTIVEVCTRLSIITGALFACTKYACINELSHPFRRY